MGWNDVFDVDEFALFLELMPDTSLVLRDEKCHGGKLSKDRLTFYTNATRSEKLTGDREVKNTEVFSECKKTSPGYVA